VGRTHPSVRKVLEVISLGVRRPERKAVAPPPTTKLGMCGAVLYLDKIGGAFSRYGLRG